MGWLIGRLSSVVGSVRGSRVGPPRGRLVGMLRGSPVVGKDSGRSVGSISPGSNPVNGRFKLHSSAQTTKLAELWMVVNKIARAWPWQVLDTPYHAISDTGSPATSPIHASKDAPQLQSALFTGEPKEAPSERPMARTESLRCILKSANVFRNDREDTKSTVRKLNLREFEGTRR